MTSIAFGPESGTLPKGQKPSESALTALYEASGPYLYLDGRQVCEALELMRWMAFSLLDHAVFVTANRLPSSFLKKMNRTDRLTLSATERKTMDNHKRWNRDPHWKRMRKGLGAYVAADDALWMSHAAQLSQETIVQLQGEGASFWENEEGTTKAMVGRYLNEKKIQVVDEGDVRYS